MTDLLSVSSVSVAGSHMDEETSSLATCSTILIHEKYVVFSCSSVFLSVSYITAHRYLFFFFIVRQYLLIFSFGDGVYICI